jgi:hypothetical protein
VDGGLKLLDRIRREPVAAAYELDDLIDDGEMFEELAFDGHRGMAEIITP